MLQGQRRSTVSLWQGAASDVPLMRLMNNTGKGKHRLAMTPEGQRNHDLALSLSKGGPRAPSVLRPPERVRGQAGSARGWKTGPAKTASICSSGSIFGSAV